MTDILMSVSMPWLTRVITSQESLQGKGKHICFVFLNFNFATGTFLIIRVVAQKLIELVGKAVLKRIFVC